MKAAATFILAALMVLLAASAAPAAMFVSPDSWIWKAALYLNDRKIVEFYPGAFGFDDYTRYEIAMVAARALSNLENESVMQRVDFVAAVQTLALLEELRPELKELGADLSWQRRQIAQLQAIASPASMFREVPTYGWAYDVTDSLLDKGILEGYHNHRKNTFTRYEFGMVVARVWSKLEDDGVMDLLDENNALQLLGLTAEFRPELTEIGVNLNILKPTIARLADEKLFVPLIGGVIP